MLLLFLLECVSELLIQNETRDGFSCWLDGWMDGMEIENGDGGGGLAIELVLFFCGGF